MSTTSSLQRRVTAEFVGTAFLVATVIGSGIMAERLAGGNVALLPHQSKQELKRYLFACIHNAGRSQMAAALFNLYADRSGCLAISAGTDPADQVHPQVVQVMREIGGDLSSISPQKLTTDLAKTASVLVTMGCGEACPFVPNLRTID
ncbi:MAG TPA: hypothetical protein VJX16_17720 [Terriglobales bacterium]|nr:hypothetical protein [Terriglobales bacterium]